MKLTPLDIQHRTFKVQFRGYQPRQVNQFLEEMAVTVETLLRENSTLREKVAAREEELTELRKAEAALTNALITTQTFTDQLKRGAQHDADMMLKEAELKSEEMLAQSRTQLTELQQSLTNLRRQRVITFEQIRSTLQTFERMLEIEEGGTVGEFFNKEESDSPYPFVPANNQNQSDI